MGDLLKTNRETEPTVFHSPAAIYHLKTREGKHSFCLFIHNIEGNYFISNGFNNKIIGPVRGGYQECKVILLNNFLDNPDFQSIKEPPKEGWIRLLAKIPRTSDKYSIYMIEAFYNLN